MSYNVAVIDNQGTLKRTIYQDNGSLLSIPRNIGLSIDQNTVYVVDFEKKKLALDCQWMVMLCSAIRFRKIQHTKKNRSQY